MYHRGVIFWGRKYLAINFAEARNWMGGGGWNKPFRRFCLDGRTMTRRLADTFSLHRGRTKTVSARTGRKFADLSEWKRRGNRNAGARARARIAHLSCVGGDAPHARRRCSVSIGWWRWYFSVERWVSVPRCWRASRQMVTAHSSYIFLSFECTKSHVTLTFFFKILISFARSQTIGVCPTLASRASLDSVFLVVVM